MTVTVYAKVGKLDIVTLWQCLLDLGMLKYAFFGNEIVMVTLTGVPSTKNSQLTYSKENSQKRRVPSMKHSTPIRASCFSPSQKNQMFYLISFHTMRYPCK